MEYLSISNILGVVGIIGVFFTIYFGIRQFRYPGKITIYKEKLISLVDEITKNLDKISIRYDDKPISPNLYLFRGVLVNTGKKDVPNNENIIFNLKEDDKWVDVKIISSSPEVKADTKVNPEKNTMTLTIKSGLFKCGEAIGIEALIEANKKKDKKDIDTMISINHRIADTQAVDIQDMPRTYKKEWKNKLLSLIWMPVAGVILMFSFYYYAKNVAEIEWHFLTDYNEEIIATGTPYVDGTMRLKGIKKMENGISVKYE